MFSLKIEAKKLMETNSLHNLSSLPLQTFKRHTIVRWLKQLNRVVKNVYSCSC